MPATTTDRCLAEPGTPFAKKQALLEQKKAAAAAGYPALWQQITRAWQQPRASDGAWLTYAANYLLRTAGVRWALDPLTLRQRLPAAPAVDAAALASLDLIVLTHRHADHLDLELLRALRHLPVRWLIPEALLESLSSLGLPANQVSVAVPLAPLRLNGLTLTPFEGLHWEADPSRPGGQRGVPAMGYLAEFNGKRWLFPGDTRTYAAGQIPAFGPLDGLFAHLWLGRGRALDDPPPLLEAFGRFCLDLQPARLVVTHLNEFGRAADQYWDEGHFRQVQQWLGAHAPGLRVEAACMGQAVRL